MIARLMRKDLLLNWSLLVVLVGGLVVAVALLWFLIRRMSEEVPFGQILFFGTFYGSLLPLMVAGRSERYRTGDFDCSLPVTRRELMAARYLLPVLLLPIWVALTYGSVWLFSGGRLPPQAWHAGTLLLAPAALTVTVGLFLPVMMRVGFMGMLYGAVGLQVVGLVLTVVIRRAPGILGLFDAIRRIGPSLRGLHASIGDPWYPLLVVATLVGLYVLSFLAADALYRRRNL